MYAGLMHLLTDSGPNPTPTPPPAFPTPIILSPAPRALRVSFHLSTALVTGSFLSISWTGKLRPGEGKCLMLGFSESAAEQSWG